MVSHGSNLYREQTYSSRSLMTTAKTKACVETVVLTVTRPKGSWYAGLPVVLYYISDYIRFCNCKYDLDIVRELDSKSFVQYLIDRRPL